MATRKTPTVAGSAWLRGTGEKNVGLTLTTELHEAAGHLAAGLGVRGRAEVGRIVPGQRRRHCRRRAVRERHPA